MLYIFDGWLLGVVIVFYMLEFPSLLVTLVIAAIWPFITLIIIMAELSDFVDSVIEKFEK